MYRCGVFDEGETVRGGYLVIVAYVHGLVPDNLGEDVAVYLGGGQNTGRGVGDGVRKVVSHQLSPRIK